MSSHLLQSRASKGAETMMSVSSISTAQTSLCSIREIQIWWSRLLTAESGTPLVLHRSMGIASNIPKSRWCLHTAFYMVVWTGRKQWTAFRLFPLISSWTARWNTRRPACPIAWRCHRSTLAVCSHWLMTKPTWDRCTRRRTKDGGEGPWKRQMRYLYSESRIRLRLWSSPLLSSSSVLVVGATCPWRLYLLMLMSHEIVMGAVLRRPRDRCPVLLRSHLLPSVLLSPRPCQFHLIQCHAYRWRRALRRVQ